MSLTRMKVTRAVSAAARAANRTEARRATTRRRRVIDMELSLFCGRLCAKVFSACEGAACRRRQDAYRKSQFSARPRHAHGRLPPPLRGRGGEGGHNTLSVCGRPLAHLRNPSDTFVSGHEKHIEQRRERKCRRYAL